MNAAVPRHRAPVLAFTVVLALLAGPAHAVQAGDATTVQVTQTYAITATIDPAAGTLDAVETLTLTNRAYRSIDHLNLSVIPRALGYLAMAEAVTVDGEEAVTAWTTTTNLRVDLPEPLAPNATAELRIPFHLTVGASGGAFTARLSRDNGVISFGEWFPILSRPHDSYGVGDPQVSYNAERIRLDLTTTSPLGRHAVACPGLLVAPAVTGTYWACEAENVRDFSFVVNPGFGLTTRTVGPTTIRVYTQTVAGAVTADRAAAALAGLNQVLGAYPWPDLVLAEVGAVDGFSMEYPRAIHLTRSKVADSYVVNHEVAHQWFYAQLGNHQMREPWLDEAFADFLARYLMGIGTSHCSSRDVDSSVFAWPAGLISGGDWQSCDGYFHAVFYRGSEFLNTVRSAMGEAEFFAALRDYLADRQFGMTTTRQLLDHLDARTTADLQPIYRDYLAEYDAAPKPDAAESRSRRSLLEGTER
jgi:hypothetical protein